jgi:hypothetical protein
VTDWNPQPGEWHPSHDVPGIEEGPYPHAWWCRTCARMVRSHILGVTAAGVAPCDTPPRDLVEKYWGVTA